jgi:uncharacterized protein YndB with AHSA1/START domain
MAQRSTEERDVCTLVQENVNGVSLEWEIWVAASPERVWEALTAGVHHWWEHSYSDKPLRIVLEPTFGGRFYEQFDEQGNGALYSTVTYCEPPHMLRYSGNQGMRGAVVNTSTYWLEEQEGGTRLRKRMDVLGDIPPETREGYRKGGARLHVCLKQYIEQGTTVR